MDKELEQLNELKQRFSYMFEVRGLGFDFYRGWLPDFIKACEAIDAVLGDDKRGFYFSQIKEKYGGARYYFRTDGVRPIRLSIHDGKGVRELTTGIEGHDIEQQIAKILNDAEKKSMTTCSVCGVPATIQNCHGWALCVCEKHAPEKRCEHYKIALIK